MSTHAGVVEESGWCAGQLNLLGRIAQKARFIARALSISYFVLVFATFAQLLSAPELSDSGVSIQLFWTCCCLGFVYIPLALLLGLSSFLLRTFVAHQRNRDGPLRACSCQEPPA